MCTFQWKLTLAKDLDKHNFAKRALKSVKMRQKWLLGVCFQASVLSAVVYLPGKVQVTFLKYPFMTSKSKFFCSQFPLQMALLFRLYWDQRHLWWKRLLSRAPHMFSLWVSQCSKLILRGEKCQMFRSHAIIILSNNFSSIFAGDCSAWARFLDHFLLRHLFLGGGRVSPCAITNLDITTPALSATRQNLSCFKKL